MDRLSFVLVMSGLLAVLAIIGWVITTWVRVRHGYPLAGGSGRPIHPQAAEEVKLLSAENARLRTELGTVKDRLATIESIVTDGSYRLGAEIERLRDRPVG